MKNLKINYAATSTKMVAAYGFSTSTLLANANIVKVKSPEANTIPLLSGEYLFQQVKNC